jgi:hypothetical protein
MTATALFELLACILALVAGIFIFDQHLERPRPYKLMWSLGLLFYGIAAGAAFVGAASHWSVADYKVWYYFGGVLTAAFLGLGSLALLAPRRVSRWAIGVAVVISIYTGLRLLLLPVDAGHANELATWSTVKVTNASDFSITPPDVLVLVILMNISGALMLFGGAVWSAWKFYRKHAPAYRLTSMVLLALGSVFPSFLTGLQRLGYSAAAPLGEFLGAGCILFGLLLSLDVFTVFRIPFTHIVLRQREATVPAQQTAAQR